MRRALRWLGFDWGYRPSILDRGPAAEPEPRHGDQVLHALERLGYLDPPASPTQPS